MIPDSVPINRPGLRRHRARSILGTIVGTAALAVGIVAGGLGTGSEFAPADPRSYPHPFVCGEGAAFGPGAAASRAGLTMTLSTQRSSTDVGPDLAVTFTADRSLHVRGSPPTLFEVLYLREGVIVGGGPMLNESGDATPQGLNLPGYGFDVDPDRPWTDALGRRDRLCAGLTWREVWSEAQRYEVVLVQGQVLRHIVPDGILLDIPTLGYWPLLVARTPLNG